MKFRIPFANENREIKNNNFLRNNSSFSSITASEMVFSHSSIHMQ